MKKKKKYLSLRIEKISRLNSNKIIGGTQSIGGQETCYGTNCPTIIEFPTIDIPTINDSCFSFCKDKCNDF